MGSGCCLCCHLLKRCRCQAGCCLRPKCQCVSPLKHGSATLLRGGQGGPYVAGVVLAAPIRSIHQSRLLLSLRRLKRRCSARRRANARRPRCRSSNCCRWRRKEGAEMAEDGVWVLAHKPRQGCARPAVGLVKASRVMLLQELPL